jgi:hypothetical protein
MSGSCRKLAFPDFQRFPVTRDWSTRQERNKGERSLISLNMLFQAELALYLIWRDDGWPDAEPGELDPEQAQ